jgi:hypothetical protein
MIKKKKNDFYLPSLALRGGGGGSRHPVGRSCPPWIRKGKVETKNLHFYENNLQTFLAKNFRPIFLEL